MNKEITKNNDTTIMNVIKTAKANGYSIYHDFLSKNKEMYFVVFIKTKKEIIEDNRY